MTITASELVEAVSLLDKIERAKKLFDEMAPLDGRSLLGCGPDNPLVLSQEVIDGCEAQGIPLPTHTVAPKRIELADVPKPTPVDATPGVTTNAPAYERQLFRKHLSKKERRERREQRREMFKCGDPARIAIGQANNRQYIEAWKRQDSLSGKRK